MKDVQTRLRALGFDVGAVDGAFGPRTKAAILGALDRLPRPVQRTGFVPADWMPDAKMIRVVCHWTAGGPTPNEIDRRAYHILVDATGKLHRGDHSIKANEAPIARAYAAHIRGRNGGAIGVSMCCMGGAVESPLDYGPFPMTFHQWRGMIEAVADLCVRYRIPVTPETVGSHAEYQAGKWDFTVLPFAPSITGATAIGNRLRAEVSAVISSNRSPA